MGTLDRVIWKEIFQRDGKPACWKDWTERKWDWKYGRRKQDSFRIGQNELKCHLKMGMWHTLFAMWAWLENLGENLTLTRQVGTAETTLWTDSDPGVESSEVTKLFGLQQQHQVRPLSVRRKRRL